MENWKKMKTFCASSVHEDFLYNVHGNVRPIDSASLVMIIQRYGIVKTLQH